jgi:hypothetical protein
MSPGLKFIRFAILAGIFVSGCGTTGPENAELARTALKPSQARLKIFRAATVVGAAGSARVQVDGRQVADLGVGGSTMLDVPAGTHKIVVDHWSHPNVYTMTLDAKPGMLYTLEVSLRPEAAVAGMFGLVGVFAEASANENGGSYQIKLVKSEPAGG